MGERQITMRLAELTIAQATMQAIGYLSTWGLSADGTDQTYPELLLYHAGNGDIGAAYKGAGRNYFIMAVFDKIAKTLGLPYPGGPEVEKSAARGDPRRFAFPRPMLGRADANFSLSGLKTAVRNEASRLAQLEPQDICDLCAGFQAAVLESTTDRLGVGLRLFHEQFGPPRALVAAGGVAANQAIRGALQDVAAKAQTTLIIPPPALCTDNGAMIAWAGAERLALGMIDTMDAPPRARWSLDGNATAPAEFANTRAAF